MSAGTWREREMAVLSIAEAEALVADALVRCRTSEKNARIVARALVAAEADGLKGHGLSRVPTYAGQAKVGKVNGFATATSTRPRPAVLAVDAAHGFAYPALDHAVGELPSIAREQGIAAAAIRRSHHCGAAGHPVERLAEAGLVALLFANTPAAIAPWGGSVGVFGTNPIAFACPLPDRAPIVVDLSLSKVARGTMLPLGDAKGTALALMVELLAAGLTGANFAAEASSFLDDRGPPPGTGQLILALDPEALGGEGTLAHCARLAAAIEEQPGTRLPGARRLALREKAAKSGLSVPEQVVNEIRELA